MRTFLFPFRYSNARCALTAAVLLPVAVLMCTGCQFYRSLGKGQNLDTPRPAPHHDVTQKGKEMIMEVTTDASGAVVDVAVRKSSGSDAVDNYVATSIRSGWPPVPSTRSLVRLHHTPNGGFSEPETISNTPIP